MEQQLQFTPQIRDWIVNNLDRGIPPAPLVRNMIGHGFDPAVAEALIHTFWFARATGAPLPEQALSPAQIAAATYRYEPSRLAADHARVALRVAQPSLAVLDSVLSTAECDELIGLATPRLAPSTIVDPVSGQDTAAASRSSEGMFFGLEENELVARIDRRLSWLMSLPVGNGEGLQILRYQPGAQSTPHFDFLMQTNEANAASVARSGQRVSTLIVYLNDVEQGGETVFPESGIEVAPRKGGGLYFEYCNSDGQLDPRSVHAGAPVLAGEKWIVTKWMRQRQFVPRQSA
ncbi:MAG TPA: 2OG-Fe(II) oxygenase [Telluria sp.]|nr:2OG-Fe(II) oxygenase [Telluria sp.]